MVTALPTPAQLMPFAPNARLVAGAAVNSASQLALAELGGAIVASCARANSPVTSQQLAVAR